MSVLSVAAVGGRQQRLQPMSRLVLLASLASTHQIVVSPRTAAWRVVRVAGLPQLLQPAAVRAMRVWLASTSNRQVRATVVVVYLVAQASGLPPLEHTASRCALLASLVDTTRLLVSHRMPAWFVKLARGRQQWVRRRRLCASSVHQAGTTSRQA